jgi:hypothetical protein
MTDGSGLFDESPFSELRAWDRTETETGDGESPSMVVTSGASATARYE